MKRKKFVFIVQGEGRGHMTQAMALYDILVSNGHHVVAVIIGKSKRREIPEYFRNKIRCPLYPLDSPNFMLDKKGKSINISSTVFYNLIRFPHYLNSIKKINEINQTYKPDFVVNFYDLLGGLYYMIYNSTITYYVIGHQYFFCHPSFKYPNGYSLARILLKVNTYLTQIRSVKQLALSFRPTKAVKNLFVIPPLLKREIFQYDPDIRNYFLAYVVNDGYGNDIIEWHKKNLNYRLHVFWDNKNYPDEYSPHENLIIHHLDDKKFHRLLLNCSGFISTAGFESICEAHYYNKPIIMVPVERQFEQLCNAVDASISEIAIHAESFDISKHISDFKIRKEHNADYRNWVQSAETLILNEFNISKVEQSEMYIY